jgi:hypothetical protein
MGASLTAAHTHASRDGKLSHPGLEGAFLWEEQRSRGLCVVGAVGTNVAWADDILLCLS